MDTTMAVFILMVVRLVIPVSLLLIAGTWLRGRESVRRIL
jgi:hypothetical protein